MTKAQKLKKLLQRSAVLGVIGLWGLLGLLPKCLMLHLLHVPCLFCGMTRSAEALLRLDWRASLVWHPLTIPFCLTVFVLLNRDILGIGERITKIWIGVMAAAFLLFWVLRVSGGPAGWAFLLPS